MDTLTQYRQQIQTILKTHALHIWDDRIQAQIIIDTEHDHYQLVYVGWRDSKRCYVADLIKKMLAAHMMHSSF